MRIFFIVIVVKEKKDLIVVSGIQYLEDIATRALLDKPLHRVRHIEVSLTLEYVLLRVWLPESYYCHFSRLLEVVFGGLLQAGVPGVLYPKVWVQLACILQVLRKGSEPLLVCISFRAEGFWSVTDTTWQA